MYNHPWTVVLLALTHLLSDAESDPAAGDALDMENAQAIEQITSLVETLEAICDVSFR